MSKRQINLRVTFTAIIEDDGAYIPADEVFAENTVALTTPVLDPKFVIFPKVLEGVTDSVISELREKYSLYLQKKADEKKRQEEEKRFLWNQSRLAETEESATS